MRAFKRSRGRYIATFEPPEVDLLADLLDQVRSLLADRRNAVPADPLAELTGMTTGSARPPEDAVLARLLPDFHHDDGELSAGMRMLREPGLVAQKDSAAVRMLDTLPRGGGTVHLDEEAAKCWLAAINDVRLALGVRLEIEEDTLDNEDLHADTPRAFGLRAYAWLSHVQESLVSAMLV